MESPIYQSITKVSDDEYVLRVTHKQLQDIIYAHERVQKNREASARYYHSVKDTKPPKPPGNKRGRPRKTVDVSTISSSQESSPLSSPEKILIPNIPSIPRIPNFTVVPQINLSIPKTSSPQQVVESN